MITWLMNFNLIVWNNNNMAPTICIRLQINRITRPMLIFVYIVQVPIWPIQDMCMSLDFLWHVVTKTELSSAQVELQYTLPIVYLLFDFVSKPVQYIVYWITHTHSNIMETSGFLLKLWVWTLFMARYTR